ncbi:glycosyl hydrolase family 114 [Nocardiopsis sp. Huas11]|uniref:endo alpha-1,4 polygalactosaminidase n=1 Tax=Nocardiopsis sp. Huas11 TaxID=2183912 RepID=UPI000EAD9497|nr:endo alpha-1,4 polygalactosaminidase [Nocardiopsis sp. Huas11]RKS04856.1 glycosyl hydrolase family 114 [Nocardiopsis sp. Huas11]
MVDTTRCAVALLALLLCAGCAGCAGTRAASEAGPPPGGPFDYQLGGAYEPTADVDTVVRDATAEPAEGRYSVCYVNGFQTQPQESARWEAEHPDLLLRGDDGEPVADPEWPDELLLDTSTPAGRAEVARVVGETVAGCAERGFDAVEFDNLDSHTRSGGRLTADDNLELASALVAGAHERGLAAAQKNAAELTGRAREEAGFDFAVAEECAAFDECAAYTDVYATVLVIEYPDTLDTPFDQVCEAPDTPATTILRDRGLLVPGDAKYLRRSC